MTRLSTDASDNRGSLASIADLNDAAKRGPVTVGQIGQALDGRVATASGHSHYVNGEGGLDHLHRLRAWCDAVIVGAGTVAVDNPSLTTRRAPGGNPVRVVIDPSGRVPEDRSVFTDGAAPTLYFGPEQRGAAETVSFDAHDPKRVLEHLHGRGLLRVLVEGGPTTLSAFLSAGTVNRLHLIVAPKILGSGQPGLVLPEVTLMDEALHGHATQYQIGTDWLIDFDLRGTCDQA